MEIRDDITLREGLRRFRDNYTGHLSHEEKVIPPRVKTFFRSHDVAHVLFGCDISLFGEGTVKIWTIFGTTLGFWRHLRKYRLANAYALSQKFTLADYLNNLPRLLIAIPGLIIRAKRMHRPWPWGEYEAYLDRPIREVRAAFNVEVLPTN